MYLRTLHNFFNDSVSMKTTVTLILLLALTGSLHSFAQKGIKAVKIGDRIDITIDNQFITSYITRDDEKYPFFFPVNGPKTGTCVTSMRNGTYPHHSSLFFGCDKVNGGNYWQEGLERGRIISKGPKIASSDAEEVVITDACDWKRPGAKQPVRDTRTITVRAISKEAYLIDFDVTLHMLMDVTIDKTNHSLFSARLDPDLSVTSGGVMINAEGEKGEKATFGKPSPWIDFYGKHGSVTEGLAIFQHPSNPWYPSPWFTRDYGFISPTPMYWPADEVSSKFKKGDTLRLRYRVIVHSGDTSEAGIAAEFEKYKALR